MTKKKDGSVKTKSGRGFSLRSLLNSTNLLTGAANNANIPLPTSSRTKDRSFPISKKRQQCKFKYHIHKSLCINFRVLKN